MLYISIQVKSGSKTHSHVHIQIRGNVVHGIYMHVVRINIYACQYMYI